MEADRRTSGRLAADRRAALALSHYLAFHGWPRRLPTGKMSPAEIWALSDDALAALLRIPTEDYRRMAAFRHSFDIDAALDSLRHKDITMIVPSEELYPFCLANIHDSPPAIFLRGTLDTWKDMMSKPRVAVVGARLASTYGIDAATSIARDLANRGVCVISGLAAGIDAAAHRGALEGSAGTIAVFGCGPDVVYPVKNRRLAHSLLESGRGLIVSEYPPGTQSRAWRFPARNRIIAGLSYGVLVVEAKEKSGALITADFALDEGREVFAVPGEIFSAQSMGPNALIRAGARAITSADDILEDLGIGDQLSVNEAVIPPEGASASCNDAASRHPALSTTESLVFKACNRKPAHQDRLAAAAGLDGATTAAALVSLEVKGLIVSEPGLGYRRPGRSR